MTNKLTKTQIDRLGDRLRQGGLVEDDLRLLDEYRRSFGEAYQAVVELLRGRLGLEPTGRSAKSTASLRDKLRRESIRLTQVQDIAGCRVIVADLALQDRVVGSLRSLFPGASIIDRRTNPSYGYRAVHVVVRVSVNLVEIQVRSELQHLWAEFSEKLSDSFDPAIKYGGGNEQVRDALISASRTITSVEDLEAQVAKHEAEITILSSKLKAARETMPVVDKRKVREAMRSIDSVRRQLRPQRREVLNLKKELGAFLNLNIARAMSRKRNLL